jgi:hypothetical protein
MPVAVLHFSHGVYTEDQLGDLAQFNEGYNKASSNIHIRCRCKPGSRAASACWQGAEPSAYVGDDPAAMTWRQPVP